MNANWWGSASDEVTGDFEVSAKFEPIPDGTSVLAAISEINWTWRNGDEYIEGTWGVLKPDEFKNRKIFQKFKVLDSDDKKSTKAKRMLAAIDKNASGGKLLALGRQPTDLDLAKFLIGKQMVLRVGLWELDGKVGNWVQAVSPKAPLPDNPSVPKKTETPDDYDDDIPGW